MFVLFAQTPNTTGNPTIRFIAASHTVVSLARRMACNEDTVETGEILVLSRFADDQAEAIRSCLERMEEVEADERDEEREQIEALLENFLFGLSNDDHEVEHDDPMDGDHESALASAGLGTDEDYGFFGGDYGDEF